MIEALGSLILSLLDAFLFRGPNADRRTYEAYAATARKYPLASEDGLIALREEFKLRSAPGAYTDPDGPALRPWIDSWRAGQSPRSARRTANRAK